MYAKILGPVVAGIREPMNISCMASSRLSILRRFVENNIHALSPKTLSSMDISNEMQGCRQLRMGAEICIQWNIEAVIHFPVCARGHEMFSTGMGENC